MRRVFAGGLGHNTAELWFKAHRDFVKHYLFNFERSCWKRALDVLASASSPKTTLYRRASRASTCSMCHRLVTRASVVIILQCIDG